MKSNLLNGINLRSQSQALTNFIRNLRKILWPTHTFSYLQRNCESFQLTTLIYQCPNTLCLSITKYLFVAPQLVLVSEIPFAQHSAFICSCSRDEKETQSGVKIKKKIPMVSPQLLCDKPIHTANPGLKNPFFHLLKL